MTTPREPSPGRDGNRAARAGVEEPWVTSELARHFGRSLALLGVMLLFFAALLGADRREQHAWRIRTQRELTALPTAASAAHDAKTSSSLDPSLDAVDAQGLAMNALDRSVLAAAIGVALAALALVLRQSNWWLIAVALVLTCLVTSTHQFKVAHAQLSQAESSAR